MIKWQKNTVPNNNQNERAGPVQMNLLKDEESVLLAALRAAHDAAAFRERGGLCPEIELEKDEVAAAFRGASGVYRRSV